VLQCRYLLSGGSSQVTQKFRRNFMKRKTHSREWLENKILEMQGLTIAYRFMLKHPEYVPCPENAKVFNSYFMARKKLHFTLKNLEKAYKSCKKLFRRTP
jgi:hypothetical protein